MIVARNVGVRFLFDRHRRVVTPATARLRRSGTETWGLREVTFDMEPGRGYALVGPSGAGKTTGMRARLGLGVADERDPNILLLDEVHEALDHEFRAVLERRAHEIVARGGIVVAAGHDHEMLSRLCSRGLWLEQGHLREFGDFATTRTAYLKAHS